MNKIIALLLSVLIITTTVSTDVSASQTEEYFDTYYDMDFWIYSEPRWLDEEIHWDDNERVKVSRVEGDSNTYKFYFEDWVDNSFDDVVFEIQANNNLIKIKRISHNTAAPDPTSIELKFDEGRFLRVVEEERTYSGKNIEIKLWDDVRKGGDTRTILIPKPVNGECDAGTYLKDGACAIGENPVEEKPNVWVSKAQINPNYIYPSDEFELEFELTANKELETTFYYSITDSQGNKYAEDRETVLLDNSYSRKVLFNASVLGMTEGNYILTVIADDLGQIEESNEQDNTKTGFVIVNPSNIKHELVVKDVELVPKNPTQTDVLQVFAALRNYGTEEQVVYSQATLKDGSKVIARSALSGKKLLPSGRISAFTMNFDLSDYSLQPNKEYTIEVIGRYTINGITYYSEPYSENFKIGNDARPDIKVKSLELIVPATQDVSQFYGAVKTVEPVSLRTEISITEEGYGIGSYTLSFYDNDELIETKVVTGEGSFTSQNFYTTSGTHTFKVVADINNRVIESDENNNEKTIVKTIQGNNDDWRNKPSASLIPVIRTVNEGEPAEFKLKITDRHVEGKDYKYNLKAISPFSTNLPGFIVLNAGETEEVEFKMFTSEVDSSAVSSAYKKDGTEYTSHFFSIQIEPEEVAYRKVVTGTVIVQKDSPPNPPTFPTDTFQVNLEEGWNLVSVPGDFVKFSGATCSGKKPVAFVYLDSKNEYVKVQDAQKILGKKFKSYMSKHSFWVYSFDECVIKVKQQTDSNEQITLQNNWNFLPAKQSMVGNSLKEMASCVTSAYEWKNQEWKKFSVDREIKESDFGKGAVVRANGACTLFADGSFSPPTLPHEEETDLGDDSKNKKVHVCHVIGNGNFQTIEIAESAVRAHLDHGDRIGECHDLDEEDSGNNDDDDYSLSEPEKGTGDLKMVMYMDLEDPFARKFMENSYDQIVEKYVDTGKVTLEFRNFPLSTIHPQAKMAAEATECAHEQGMFWEYFEELYAHKGLSDSDLITYATNAGLEDHDFADCLQEEKYRLEVEDDFSDAKDDGVRGSPAFKIGNEWVMGAVPDSYFETAIERQLEDD